MTLDHPEPTWCQPQAYHMERLNMKSIHVNVDKGVPLASPYTPTSSMIPPESLYALPWRLKMGVFYCCCNNLLPF
ncbi:hypothetical protein LEMLEM_LOCUS3912 [Lemmus lemmus]